VQIGINQDIIFKGERFHIQTEDSGVKRPVISTVLFKGGLIIASRKTGYGDKLDSANLDRVVSELMQGQHKEVIRALKNGDFEKEKRVKAADRKAASAGPVTGAAPAPASEPAGRARSKRPLMVSKKVLENKVLECLSLK